MTTQGDRVGPDIRNVHSTYYGVREFGPAVRVFRDGLGWRAVDFDEIDRVDCLGLWGVDAPAEVLTLAPDHRCQSGIVTLLRFPEDITPAPHGAPSITAFGNFALSIYAKNTEATVERAVAAGARLHGELNSFPVPRNEEIVHLKTALL